MRLRYFPEECRFAVMLGKERLGFVSCARHTYDHSNGRIYRGDYWGAFPEHGKGNATFYHSSRTKAGAYLLRLHLETVSAA